MLKIKAVRKPPNLNITFISLFPRLTRAVEPLSNM
jgi:hypothetical protein